MSNEQPRPTTGTLNLTPAQTARLDYARRQLDSTRAEDLTQLDDAGLILIIEGLRRRLDDTLQLVDEILDTEAGPS